MYYIIKLGFLLKAFFLNSEITAWVKGFYCTKLQQMTQIKDSEIWIIENKQNIEMAKLRWLI